MKYAVISSGNKQYKVSEGMEIVVDRLGLKPNETYNFSRVLLLVDEGKRQIGNPVLTSVVVKAKIISDEKGPKIRVSKFKAKAKYRRVRGFRAQQTRLRIEKISS